MKALALFLLLVPAAAQAEMCGYYPGAVEDKAVEIEAASIEQLQSVIEKALQEQSYNEWVLEAQDQLRQIKPELVGRRYELPLVPSDTWVTD